jgi:hypothetical protein
MAVQPNPVPRSDKRGDGKVRSGLRLPVGRSRYKELRALLG